MNMHLTWKLIWQHAEERDDIMDTVPVRLFVTRCPKYPPEVGLRLLFYFFPPTLCACLGIFSFVLTTANPVQLRCCWQHGQS